MDITQRWTKIWILPEVDKCIVIVDSNHETEARSAFKHLGVTVYRFLGGFIGDHDSIKAFVWEKIIIDEHCQTVQSG